MNQDIEKTQYVSVLKNQLLPKLEVNKFNEFKDCKTFPLTTKNVSPTTFQDLENF